MKARANMPETDRLKWRVEHGPGIGADHELDGAIKHTYEMIADDKKDWCLECKSEHIQLLEWLLELRYLRDLD